jgi:3-oxoacyl-[acyl-carrier protein] reductase
METTDTCSPKLRDKVALITGAARSRGMGYTIGKLLAQAKAAVILVDIREEVLERVDELKSNGHTVIGYRADLMSLIEVEKLVNNAISQFGRIDILCNSAGGSVPPRPSFLDMSEDYWNDVLDRNLRTTFNMCKAVVPYMVTQNYGKIVNISSITGPRVVYRFSAAYAAAKAGVSAFTKALALELGENNVTANSILPGDIDTADEPWTTDKGPRDLGTLTPHLRPPVSRPGMPEEIAALALFLSTDDSKFITGADIVIDGGATIVEPFPSPPK